MVNVTEIFKNRMAENKTTFVKLPFSLTINGDDFAFLSSKIDEKQLRDIYEKVVRESTSELVNAINKSNLTLSMPVREVIKHEVRGEFGISDDSFSKIKRFIEENGPSRLTDIMEGLNYTNGFAMRRLSAMVEQGILVRDGFKYAVSPLVSRNAPLVAEGTKISFMG